VLLETIIVGQKALCGGRRHLGFVACFGRVVFSDVCTGIGIFAEGRTLGVFEVFSFSEDSPVWVFACWF